MLPSFIMLIRNEHKVLDMKYDGEFFGYDQNFTDFSERDGLELLGEYEVDNDIKIYYGKPSINLIMIAKKSYSYFHEWDFMYMVKHKGICVLLTRDESVVRDWFEMFDEFNK